MSKHIPWTPDGVTATSARATPGEKKMGANDMLRDEKEGLKKERGVNELAKKQLH